MAVAVAPAAAARDAQRSEPSAARAILPFSLCCPWQVRTAVEEALTRILTPKRSIDILREARAAQVRRGGVLCARSLRVCSIATLRTARAAQVQSEA